MTLSSEDFVSAFIAEPDTSVDLSDVTDHGDDDYVEDQVTAEAYRLNLGDSCTRMAELDDDSVDMSVYSPPFASLFTYSPSERDIGNCSTWDEFIAHYSFVIREMLRVTKPGRKSCVHAADVATTKATHGFVGMRDLTGAIIQAHLDAGWIWENRVFVDKDPQAVAIRTKAHHLMFVTKNRDSAAVFPCAADQLLLFRKPGVNDVAIPHDADGSEHGEHPGVSNADWIAWARPVWLNVRETNVIASNRSRDEQDERHLHVLNQDFIQRCVRLYSNPGELVVSPCGGVGSEAWAANKLGRKAWTCELKPSYWRQAVQNLRALDAELSTPALLDLPDIA